MRKNMNSKPSLNYWDLVRDHPKLFDNTEALLEIITDKSRIEAFQDEYGRELEERGLPRAWSEIGVVYDDPYVIILRDLVKFADGSIKPYSRLINRADLKGGQGVVMLPILDNKIIILEQYRHATRSWHLELPRGFGSIGLSASENARNEIKEEIGGDVLDLLDLGICHNNTGMEGGFAQLFLAKLSSLGEPNQVEGIKRIKRIDLANFEDLLEKGAITDCFSIAAYTRAKLKGYLRQ